MLAARRGDPAAFERLVRKYAGVVRALVAVRMRNRTDVEDTCQEVFLQAFRRLDALSDPERFAGWISRIAVNKARESLRRMARRPAASLDAAGPEPVAEKLPDQVAAAEEVERMRAVLDELDDKTRQVLSLRYLQGMAVRDIAAQLGDQPPAISMRITRGLRRLRARLEARS